ncbi:LCP family protein [Microbacterium trichothecenolyticum]|uniref:LCP family protein required for cell wall assembly n=1 Tax=Microbacterium trichothecenolyticum TaxID=69370 RepID=A0ABU0TTM0_MICTR|nr:LCP family protein [Microbacterium trichothecenolyticum]MDQ1122984.1 LCP family protein required for cell wall assembly [Microbacterium trichothecenolyticum]
MSVAAPPRSRAHASLVEQRPLRTPDATSVEVMTRRGWWLIVLNFLLPGSAQVLAGNRRLGRFGLGATLAMWTVLVLAALGALLWPSGLFTLATGSFIPDFLSLLRPLPLTVVQIVLVGYVALWVVLSIDTLRLVRLVRVGPLARLAMTIVSIGLLVLSGSGAVWAAQAAGTTRDAFADIFAQSAPVVPPSDGYYNILLLGADSGEGRDSMRFDSISVVSINADTGATTITGIPRDMPHFPFAPGPMQDEYPDGHTGHADATCGWGSGINQLRTEVEVCQDGNLLYPGTKERGTEPGIEATKDAAEGILGIQIPYYVLIDMKGFADVVDALGGVDIDVQERLPKGGPAYDGQPVDDWAFGWIEPGQQHMDGDTAQWYARSRYTTSDFDRMRRQRELQEAILAQFTPQVVLTRFQQVAQSTTSIVQTDLPQGLIAPTLVDLALKAKDQPLTTIELTPEGGVDEYDPDYAQVQQMVRDKLHPPTPTEEPSS